MFVKAIANFLVFQFFFRGEEELKQLSLRFFVQGEVVPRGKLMTALIGRTTKRIIGVFFVEPIIFVKNRNVGIIFRRNVTIDIPHDLEMVVHFTATPHVISIFRIVGAIASATADGITVKDEDVFSGNSRIAN